MALFKKTLLLMRFFVVGFITISSISNSAFSAVEVKLEKPEQLDPLLEKSFNGVWDSKSLEELLTKFKFFSKTCYSYDPLNFGVVLNNKHHKIYRSRALGERGVEELFKFLKQSKLELPSTVVFMNKEGYKTNIIGTWASPITHVLNGMTPFVYEQARLFAKSGKFPEIDFYHPLNSHVFLSGQDPLNDIVSHPLSTIAEPEILDYFEEEINDNGLKNIIASRSSFLNTLELVLGGKGPVLFHCTGGLHRTGMVALAIRYLQGGNWVKSFKRPIEVKIGLRGKTSLLSNLAEVEYYLHNSWRFRSKNLKAIRSFSETEQFKALQKRYQSTLNEPSTCAKVIKSVP
ncbi:MAG: tyrosine-protein phosphatase [Oligoflexales bacterium]|nr:tyrosine-protein phosphatase [Oligoflexales bacterium]